MKFLLSVTMILSLFSLTAEAKPSYPELYSLRCEVPGKKNISVILTAPTGPISDNSGYGRASAYVRLWGVNKIGKHGNADLLTSRLNFGMVTSDDGMTVTGWHVDGLYIRSDLYEFGKSMFGGTPGVHRFRLKFDTKPAASKKDLPREYSGTLEVVGNNIDIPIQDKDSIKKQMEIEVLLNTKINCIESVTN